MFDRHDLTDEKWARLEPLLPDRTPRRGGRWAGHRSVINGATVAEILRFWPSRTRVAACCAGQLRVVIVASMSRAGDVVYYATCACGERWFGLNRAHSTCCHRTWDDAELFDAHRLDEVCRTPRSMRLVQNAQGVWMRRRDGLPRGA